MSFKAARTVIALEPTELVQLQQILMDDDQPAALAFLREVIGEKIKCAQDDSHRPEFEGGIRLQASHLLSQGPGHTPRQDEGEAG